MNQLGKAEIIRALSLYKAQKKIELIKEPTLILTSRPIGHEIQKVTDLVVANGSYDPLSVAHEALFIKGLETVESENKELLITTSIKHIDKDPDFSKNSTIPDRLQTQEGFSSAYDNVSIGLFNERTFVALKEAITKVYNPNVNVYFIIGADVLEKIADPKYNAERSINIEESFPKVFANKFIVSSRNTKSIRDGRIKMMDVDSLVRDYPDLKKYSNQLIPVRLDKKFEEGLEVKIENISSTLIRTKRQENEPYEALMAQGLSELVNKKYQYLEDPTNYIAITSAIQMYGDYYFNQAIANYANKVVKLLNKMENSPQLKLKVIEAYKKGELVEV